MVKMSTDTTSYTHNRYVTLLVLLVDTDAPSKVIVHILSQ